MHYFSLQRGREKRVLIALVESSRIVGWTRIGYHWKVAECCITIGSSALSSFFPMELWKITNTSAYVLAYYCDPKHLTF